MKNYNQSPLPFQGQKRNFLKAFKLALNEFSTQTIFVDLFGGSGLLSQIVEHSKMPPKPNLARRLAITAATPISCITTKNNNDE